MEPPLLGHVVAVRILEFAYESKALDLMQVEKAIAYLVLSFQFSCL